MQWDRPATALGSSLQAGNPEEQGMDSKELAKLVDWGEVTPRALYTLTS